MADESFLSWAYAGVNNTLAGNGGPDCVAFIPPLQRALETVLFTVVGLMEMYIAYPHIRLQAMPVVPSTMHRTGRRMLIAIMCLMFGIELGFKFATRQMIWILNPCHIVTLIQVHNMSPYSVSSSSSAVACPSTDHSCLHEFTTISVILCSIPRRVTTDIGWP